LVIINAIVKSIIIELRKTRLPNRVMKLEQQNNKSDDTINWILTLLYLCKYTQRLYILLDTDAVLCIVYSEIKIPDPRPSMLGPIIFIIPVCLDSV